MERLISYNEWGKFDQYSHKDHHQDTCRMEETTIFADISPMLNFVTYLNKYSDIFREILKYFQIE